VHRVQPFAPEHTDQVSALCAAEGWSSWTPERTRAALSAPGVIALVALDGERVIGAAELLTDGVVMGYLGLLLVAAEARGQGVGRSLVEELFHRSGLERLDLLAEEASTGFYEAAFEHRRKPGVRIYAA
jgi:ribosomal protein S18 acetylase RimI-like enzyme